MDSFCSFFVLEIGHRASYMLKHILPPLSYSQFNNWIDFSNNMIVMYHFRRIVRIPFSQKFLHEIDETWPCNRHKI
jgi:hypothetical protein